MENIKPTVLVIAGAGTKGIYGYLGPIYVLQKTNWLSNVHTIAGTSIGSFFAACICLGYNMKDLISFAWSLNYCKYASKISISKFLQKGFGTDTMIVKEWLQSLITKKLGKKDITLKELYEYSGKIFMCNSIYKPDNESNPIHKIYTFKTNPNLYLSDVVQQSCNLPILFESNFVDGGVINNFLIDQFDDKKEKILGIRFKKIFPNGFKPIPIRPNHHDNYNFNESTEMNQKDVKIVETNQDQDSKNELIGNDSYIEFDENLLFTEILASMNHPGLSTIHLFKNLLWVFMVQNQELENLRYKNISYDCIQLQPLNLTTFSIFVSDKDKLAMFYKSLYTTIIFLRNKIKNL